MDLIKEAIASLPDTLEEWTYVEPRLFNRQLSAALKKPEIQQAFHDVCTVAAAGKRWESLRFLKYRQVPRPFEPTQGELLRPIDIETSDWRWSLPPGRPPTWHYYTTSHLCHWLCYGNLLLAQHLFPQVEWCIVSNERHSTVVNFSSKLVFDLYYSAAGVSMESCLQMLFGNDYTDDSYGIFDENTYSYTDGVSGMALELFERIDTFEGDKQEMLRGMRSILEMECDIDDEGSEVFTAIDATDMLIAA